MFTEFYLPSWPTTYSGPSGCGNLRTVVEDFIVDEIPQFELSGCGEHAFVRIQKRSQNTEYVARQLAKFAQVPVSSIGYAGLKDRHALTSQWFSVWLPGKEHPDWTDFSCSDYSVLDSGQHNKKLKRGVLAGNRFNITIRNWQGDQKQTEQILSHIQNNGIANYFGNQRFGHDGSNILNAMEMFQGAKVRRQQKSIYLSAIRSYLFNQVLAERINQKIWDCHVPGDVMMLDKSSSHFICEHTSEDIRLRLENGNIHPSGMLFGLGELSGMAAAREIEQQVIEAHQNMVLGLQAANVTMARRSLRVRVEELYWHFPKTNALQLKFFLPAGSYATTLLREIIRL